MPRNSCFLAGFPLPGECKLFESRGFVWLSQYLQDPKWSLEMWDERLIERVKTPSKTRASDSGSRGPLPGTFALLTGSGSSASPWQHTPWPMLTSAKAHLADPVPPRSEAAGDWVIGLLRFPAGPAAGSSHAKCCDCSC